MYLSIDNSRSQVACANVLLILRQNLQLNIRGQIKNIVNDVVVRELAGVGHGQVKETKLASLQLPPRQAGDYLAVKSSGDLKEILIKESSFINTISSSTSGRANHQEFFYIAYYSSFWFLGD